MAWITRNAIAILRTSSPWAISFALLLALATVPALFSARSHGPRGEKRIALTLDDGPNPPYTEKFLQLLQREQVPATFFFIGRNIEIHRATALAVARSGHAIGNHSYSHLSLALVTPWRIAEEFHRTDDLIRGLGYAGPIAIRAPFGQNWGGLPWFFVVGGRRQWLYDVAPEPADYLRADPAVIAASTVRRTQSGSVLLFHDGEGIRIESLEAAARAIGELKAAGFAFVPLAAFDEKASRP